jgi:hypothetical protein
VFSDESSANMTCLGFMDGAKTERAKQGARRQSKPFCPKLAQRRAAPHGLFGTLNKEPFAAYIEKQLFCTVAQRRFGVWQLLGPQINIRYRNA